MQHSAVHCLQSHLWVHSFRTYCFASCFGGIRDTNSKDNLSTMSRTTNFMESCMWMWLAYLLQDLCRKSIKHNASSGKAWERLGSILEREQAYKVALLLYAPQNPLDVRCLLWLCNKTGSMARMHVYHRQAPNHVFPTRDTACLTAILQSSHVAGRCRAL